MLKHLARQHPLLAGVMAVLVVAAMACTTEEAAPPAPAVQDAPPAEVEEPTPEPEAVVPEPSPEPTAVVVECATGEIPSSPLMSFAQNITSLKITAVGRWFPPELEMSFRAGGEESKAKRDRPRLEEKPPAPSQTFRVAHGDRCMPVFVQSPL